MSSHWLMQALSVRPDSKLLLTVFKQVVEEEDFQERLDAVRARVDEIEVSCKKEESLHG